MSSVNKVNFLLEAATLFSPNEHVNRLLKSHFLTTGREVAQKDIDLPRKEFGETRMCPKCSAVWLDGNLRLEVKSKKLKKTNQRKLLAKLEKDELLTRKQKIKAKWLKKNHKSRVEITCLLCKQKTKLHLDKSTTRKQPVAPQPSDPPQITTTTIELSESSSQTKSTKKKKKKKKDRFAGLNATLINSQPSTSTSCTSSSSSNSLQTRDNCTSTSSKLLSSSTTSTSNQNTLSTKTPTSSSSASSSSLTAAQQKTSNQILKSSKSIKKSKDKAKTPPKREVSKTQRKNTLLQLAQLLKSSSHSSTNKKPNHLENLLR